MKAREGGREGSRKIKRPRQEEEMKRFDVY